MTLLLPMEPRIVIVIDQLESVGGAELSVLRLAEELQHRHIFIRLVTLSRVARSLFEPTIPVDELSLNRTYDLPAFRAAIRLWKFIREHKINLAVTIFESSDLWAAPIARAAGCKVVSYRRDMGIQRTRKHRLAYRILTGLFDRVLAVSDGVRDWTIEHDALDPRKVVTVAGGVPTFKPAPLPKEVLGFSNNRFTVLTVANLRKEKGIDLLVSAAKYVASKRPEVLFVVAGGAADPTFAASVEQEINQSGLIETVKLLGFQKQIHPLLSSADIFVLPSRTEGLSNALLEAMSAGLPCVATNVGGNRQALGDAGLIVPPESIAIAEAILRLASDCELRGRFSAASKKRVQENFSIEAAADRFEETIRPLLVN